MPLDSRNKRASAVHVSLPWRGLLPLPDGTITAADRQQIAWHYSGIAATDAPTGDGLVSVTLAGLVLSSAGLVSGAVSAASALTLDPLMMQGYALGRIPAVGNTVAVVFDTHKDLVCGNTRMVSELAAPGGLVSGAMWSPGLRFVNFVELQFLDKNDVMISYASTPAQGSGGGGGQGINDALPGSGAVITFTLTGGTPVGPVLMRAWGA